MAPALLIDLIIKIGLPAAKSLYDLHQKGATVTPEDFAKLEELANYDSNKALAAAGIKIVDGKVVFI